MRCLPSLVTIIFLFNICGCSSDDSSPTPDGNTAAAMNDVSGPIDLNLFLDMEKSVSAFVAKALNEGEVRPVGSMNRVHNQNYKVIKNLFGRQYSGEVEVTNSIGLGGTTQVTSEMSRIKKGDRVILLARYNFGWSRGTKGRFLVTRILDDTESNRPKLTVNFTEPVR